MKRFIVEEDFWAVFPQAKIGVILLKDIDNRIRQDSPAAQRLGQAVAEAKQYLTQPEFSNNAVVKVWREAFSQFKTKKGARSSIEALLKRVSNDQPLGSINPLVDLYNSISLQYALPCGGEDIDCFVGDVRLTKAIGDEAFVTLGSEESSPPLAGEIVYKDEAGAICRCWNWRESVRTMLTEHTTNAFLCIELVDLSRLEAFEQAISALSKLSQTYLGGTAETFILDINQSSIDIG